LVLALALALALALESAHRRRPTSHPCHLQCLSAAEQWQPHEALHPKTKARIENQAMTDTGLHTLTCWLLEHDQQMHMQLKSVLLTAADQHPQKVVGRHAYLLC
jgi:hypothetical protein